ncbi:hypothetical protein NQ314_001050 [Rhamnusium bicolor]|uniref:HTH psq-type domain-containing protein n=1 Tax=Rhamnusium bicolor TaxID=1586634 RepID=A0AAV8ZSW2_9CUCU|nr:hypothetical protein NQ314_001050 [Rhamnusium bicolor]
MFGKKTKEIMRTYKRKSTQYSWNEESMIAAIRAVRSDELSQNAAARQYDVPVATLHRRLKTGKDEIEASRKKLGRFTTVFTSKLENALAEHVLNMEKIFFGLSTNELRRLAFQYAELNGIPNDFNKEKN